MSLSVIQAYGQLELSGVHSDLAVIEGAVAYLESDAPELPVPVIAPPHFLTYAEHIGDIPSGAMGTEETPRG